MTFSEIMPALIETVTSTVRQSMEEFASNHSLGNREELTSQLVSRFSLLLHQSMAEASRAGLAQLIEGFDLGEPALVREGLTYGFKGRDPKTFLTIFGEIVVNRSRYAHWKGGPSIVPLDEAWEMQGRYATPEVTEQLLFGVSMVPPGELSQLLGRICPYQPSASLIQDLANQDGARIDELLSVEEHAAEMRPPDEATQIPAAIVVSMDGANVLVREPGRKRGRRAALAIQEDGQPKSCSYKNAMVGSISRYKTVEKVIDIETGAEATVSQRISSRYHARMPEPRAQTFKTEFERQVAQEIDLFPGDVIKILLMDGARPLWNYAENNELFDDFKKLVDFYHASEHLNSLAEALFGKDSPAAETWYKKWRHKLKHERGGVDGLLRSADRYKKEQNLSKAWREKVEKEQTYFRRNREKMNYHEHVSQGLPIGSGPVEAACKTVVKARMCQSGMRWSKAGGQNILNLRVLQRSGQWDAAWKHYRAVGGYHFTERSGQEKAAA